MSEGRKSEGRKPGAASIALYTFMRLGLFVAVWLLLQLLTPLRGLWAVVIAILASGVISLFLLSKQRAAMSAVVGGFFGRINDRIDAASRGEDDWDEQSHADGGGVGDDQVTGGDQGRDQARAGGTAADEAQRTDGPERSEQPE